MKTTKRLISLCLVLAMVCALAIPAYAGSYFTEGTLLEGKKDFYYECTASCSSKTAKASIGYMGTTKVSLTATAEDATGYITRKNNASTKSSSVSFTSTSTVFTSLKATFYVGSNQVGTCSIAP